MKDKCLVGESMTVAKEKKLFKDWFDREAAEALADQVGRVMPRFDRQAFVKQAVSNLQRLEFHDRVAAFSKSLRDHLPQNVPKALAILKESLPPCLPGADSIAEGWRQWPLGRFIGDYGVPYFDESMEAMTELTRRFTAEFAVRPFLENDPRRTLAYLRKQTGHPCVHVRRWCSEGTRPRLPWGKRLQAFIVDPSPVFPILEALKDDPERYVQKSVANHLNDIGKDHPGILLERSELWLRQAEIGRQWIVRHALRSLIKQGNSRALSLLGFAAPEDISATLQITPARVCLGQSVQLAASIRNNGRNSLRVVVDYAVHYTRQRGKVGRKVFKWTQLEISPGDVLELQKMHPMKATTIRALYPGTHRVELQVSGHSLGSAEFELAD